MAKEIVGCVEVSIQVFDRYIVTVYEEERSILGNTAFLSYAAACSALLAVKLMDAKSPLNMVRNHLSESTCGV